jgi:hypothetical protein
VAAERALALYRHLVPHKKEDSVREDSVSRKEFDRLEERVADHERKVADDVDRMLAAITALRTDLVTFTAAFHALFENGYFAKSPRFKKDTTQ